MLAIILIVVITCATTIIIVAIIIFYQEVGEVEDKGERAPLFFFKELSRASSAP